MSSDSEPEVVLHDLQQERITASVINVVDNSYHGSKVELGTLTNWVKSRVTTSAQPLKGPKLVRTDHVQPSAQNSPSQKRARDGSEVAEENPKKRSKTDDTQEQLYTFYHYKKNKIVTMSRVPAGEGEKQIIAYMKVVHPFIDDGPKSVDFLKHNGVLRCVDCHQEFKYENKTTRTNLGRHVESQKHTVAVASKASSAAIEVVPIDVVIDHKELERQNLFIRESFALSVIRKIPYTLAKSLYSEDIMAMASHIVAAGRKVGASTTMRRDIVSGAALLQQKIKAKVKGTVGCIVMDGATTDFLTGEKPVTIIWESSSLPHPIMLGLILMSEVKDGTAESYVPVVKKMLVDNGIDYAQQATCIVGDNVAWNTKFASLMQLPHSHCLPHSLNLVCKVVVNAFSNIEALTTSLGTVLHAGGSKARGIELQNWKGSTLYISKLSTHENRFATQVKMLSYLLTEVDDAVDVAGNPAGKKLVFHVVRDWINNSELLNSKTKKSKDASTGDQKDSKALKAIKESYNNSLQVFEASVCFFLLKDLQVLIQMASATISHVSSKLPSKLREYKQLLTNGSSNDLRARNMLLAVHATRLLDFPEEDVNSLQATVMKACNIGLQQFNKFVDLDTGLMHYRFKFDPRTMPTPFIEFKKDFNEYNPAHVQAFFGCLPHLATPKLCEEYTSYLEEWPTTIGTLDSKEREALEMGAYWNDKKRRENWDTLCTVGTWYADGHVSAISAERPLAI